MRRIRVPLIIRGSVVEGDELEFSGRRGEATLVTPDVRRHLAILPLKRPSDLAELYGLSFDEIIAYLAELGGRLRLDTNSYLQEALEASKLTSGLTEGILANAYGNVGRFLSPTAIRDWVERTIGIAHLEGWVKTPFATGGHASVRAFGARAVHVVAGNLPFVSLMTVAQNALTRGDAIIKAPSNDPLTAVAVARTMIDMAPDHPLTRRLSVAYWKGGDAQIEDELYQPRHIEKIVAWGGFASVTHVAKYVQPGIELITLDPKLSSTIIGRAAFDDEATLQAVAERLANDIGCNNQEGCVNARVVYVQTGTDGPGIALANRFADLVHRAILALPPHVSSASGAMPLELEDELQGLRFSAGLHKVFGGGESGAVIVSQLDEPVEFAALLSHRVANLVPVDSLDVAIRAINSYTQTIGIYPEALKAELRDRIAIQGGQRLVSLGYATGSPPAGPQDATEPFRRLCRWVVEECYEPSEFPLPSRRPPAGLASLAGAASQRPARLESDQHR